MHKLTVLSLAAVTLTAGAETVWFEDHFENGPDKRWSYHSCREAWRVEPGAGRKGSTALVWVNTNATVQPELHLRIPQLKGGCRAEVTFWVKVDELKGRVGTCLEWGNAKTGKYIAGVGLRRPFGDKENPIDAEGWQQVSLRTTPIANTAGTPVLELCMQKKATGRVRIDDLEVRPYDERHVGLVAASGYRGEVCRGDVRFAAQFWASLDDVMADRTVGEFTYESAAGGKKTVRAAEKSEEALVAAVPVTDLRMGRQTVTFALRDLAAKRTLGTGSVDVTRLAEEKRRKSYVDECGRTVVDGKLFFPIGSWWSPRTYRDHPEALDLYASAAFNVIPSYDRNVTLKDLDDFWARGLRVTLSLKNYYEPLTGGDPMGCTFPPADLKTKADKIRYLTENVNLRKNHPAVIAYYTCDEIPRCSAWRIAENYRIIAGLDDEHIQYADTSDHAGTGYFLNSADVVGPDPFFRQDGTDSIEWVLGRQRAGLDALCGIRSAWGHASISFDLGWCDANWKNGTPSRLPNEAEARALSWIPIAAGANGLMIYSLGEMYDRRAQGRCLPAEFDENWRIVKKIVGEVAQLTDILLLPPGPKLKTADSVAARAYRSEKGTYLLLVNAAREAKRGTVAFPSVPTRCEPVFGTATVTPGKEAVAYTLPPLGVAIVRLRAD